MKVIAVGHYSRVGKDSFANALLASLREYNPVLRVAKKSFAWKLKQICYELYSWAGMKPPEWYETPEGEKDRNIVLPGIRKTPVEVWVDFGTPAVREKVYDRTWIDYVLKTDLGVDILILPDVRFPNEAQAIIDSGGTLIKVVRPGYGPRKSLADRALLCYREWDYVIGASGEMRELQQWASKFGSWLTGGPVPFQSPGSQRDAYGIEVIEPWERDHEWLQPGWTLRDGKLAEAA